MRGAAALVLCAVIAAFSQPGWVVATIALSGYVAAYTVVATFSTFEVAQ